MLKLSCLDISIYAEGFLQLLNMRIQLAGSDIYCEPLEQNILKRKYRSLFNYLQYSFNSLARPLSSGNSDDSVIPAISNSSLIRSIS
jgi:hypothetical protein